MTYCIYALVGKNVDALKNGTLFAELVNRVFETFFQHFVSHNVSFTEPSRVYQSIGAQPDYMGQRIFYNRSDGYMRKGEPIQYPILNTSRIVRASIEHEVEILSMNALATWMSVGILAWLILTALILLFTIPRYLRPLRRNVECMADIMALISGSKRFLGYVHERTIQDLKDDNEALLRLGWFKTKAGEMRWGVELIERDCPDAVEWIDHPVICKTKR